MFDSTHFFLFLTIAIIILVIPGPAVFYIVARSIEQGRTAGIVSVAGISTATLAHALAAALGLSAILMSSALVFEWIKYLGAAYLIYLGLRSLFGKQRLAVPGALKIRSLRRLFTEGFLVNLFNPKTALFFFAFLPQFVVVEQGAVALQIFLLGSCMAVLGFISDGLWALFAGSLAAYLQQSPRALKVQAYLSGGTLIGLGLFTALTETRRVSP